MKKGNKSTTPSLLSKYLVHIEQQQCVLSKDVCATVLIETIDHTFIRASIHCYKSVVHFVKELSSQRRLYKILSIRQISSFLHVFYSNRWRTDSFPYDHHAHGEIEYSAFLQACIELMGANRDSADVNLQSLCLNAICKSSIKLC